jgi:class 3 adenylate cyclase
MGTLDSERRAQLPDSAFAYIDSKGKRKLPINDEAHVRNALARFNQVRFDTEDDREKTFQRLLAAASSHGIAPVGFVSRRLQEARRAGRPDLPSGQVALLLADVEGSTALAESMGDEYPGLIEDVRATMREIVTAAGGYEVDARGDEFFAAFADAVDGLRAAISVQRDMRRDVRLRIGLHCGAPAVSDTGYEGLAVHVLARVCSAGHGGQILISVATRSEMDGRLPDGVDLESLGAHVLHGISDPMELFQVTAPGLVATHPPLRAPSA